MPKPDRLVINPIDTSQIIIHIMLIQIVQGIGIIILMEIYKQMKR